MTGYTIPIFLLKEIKFFLCNYAGVYILPNLYQTLRWG